MDGCYFLYYLFFALANRRRVRGKAPFGFKWFHQVDVACLPKTVTTFKKPCIARGSPLLIRTHPHSPPYGQPPPKGTPPRRLGSFATAEEAALAYDEAARRLFGPDAYLNLPHLRAHGKPPAVRYEWFPSERDDASVTPPACGLLNLNAQHNIHAIHQRLQELNNHPEPPPPRDASSSSSSVVGAVEKPQIDLKEFLQQLGVLKPPEGTAAREEETDETGSQAMGLHPSDDFNWDTLLTTEDGRWQLDEVDVQRRQAGYPISIWDL